MFLKNLIGSCATLTIIRFTPISFIAIELGNQKNRKKNPENEKCCEFSLHLHLPCIDNKNCDCRLAMNE